MCNFDRGYPEEKICEILLNLDLWLRSRCLLKIFVIWSSGCPLFQRSLTICAILVEELMRNYFEFGPVVQEEMSFKRFLIWSSGGTIYKCNCERGHHD